MNKTRHIKLFSAVTFLALIFTGCQNCSRPDAVLKQEDPFFDVTAEGTSKLAEPKTIKVEPRAKCISSISKINNWDFHLLENKRAF